MELNNMFEAGSAYPAPSLNMNVSLKLKAER